MAAGNNGAGKIKVLVLYDTVSSARLTQEVAETINNSLKEEGIDADASSVGDVDKSAIMESDFLVVGAPTMAFRMSQGMSKFLDEFSASNFSGKCGAAFDTQVQMFISGNAAKDIEGRMRKLGIEIIAPPFNAYVEGKMGAMKLREGELDKAEKWAQELARIISK